MDEDIKISLKNEIENNITNMNNSGIYGLDINFNCADEILNSLYKQGKFILAYYDSNRVTTVEVPREVEKIQLKDVYTLSKIRESHMDLTNYQKDIQQF